MAPARAQRPGLASGLGVEPPSAHDPECPFCEGNEAATPPETLAFGRSRAGPDQPGWRLRVVPNRFPALAGSLGRQEVAIHAPRHATSLADLSGTEAELIATAWQARARAARDEGFPYVHAFVNEGRAAGSTLPHTHSQLAWLPAVPPAVETELAAAAGGCALCRLLAAERPDGQLLVGEEDGVVALCPPAGRLPYEALIAPVACEPDAFASALLPVAVRRAASLVASLQALAGRVPLNLWLHTSPLARGGLHWHLELLPRLSGLAGLELGAGVFVNPLAPEAAAALLRAQARGGR